jgi:hypothetical protein
MTKKKSAKAKKNDAISKTISEEMHKGHPQDQAIAIAFSKQSAGKKGKKKKK